MKRAGLASDKEIRQAQHQERVRRKELGQEGLEEERRRLERERQAAQVRRRDADRERERLLQQRREAQSRTARIAGLLQDADTLPREGGPRRFFFEMPAGPIAFIDVSEGLARRLVQGDAAIVAARGLLARDFAVVGGKAAREVEQLDRERLLFWNIRR
ncbi:MAG: DUF2058 family protein [Candidatus Eisenbacteria bacterium]